MKCQFSQYWSKVTGAGAKTQHRARSLGRPIRQCLAAPGPLSHRRYTQYGALYSAFIPKILNQVYIPSVLAKGRQKRQHSWDKDRQTSVINDQSFKWKALPAEAPLQTARLDIPFNNIWTCFFAYSLLHHQQPTAHLQPRKHTNRLCMPWTVRLKTDSVW